MGTATFGKMEKTSVRGPDLRAARRAAGDRDVEYRRRLLKRRLEALAVARRMNVDEVDASPIETFEPEELQHA